MTRDPGAPLALRTASPADAPAIAALVNAAFALEHEWVEGDRTSEEEVAALLRQGIFLVVDGDAKPIACAYVEQKGYRCYLGMLAVDPAQQKAGLGRRMMTAAEEFARSRRARSMDIRILSVRQELPAFYHRLGYVDEGTAPYENPRARVPAHYILMSKVLQ